jgi:hypothetical protein
MTELNVRYDLETGEIDIEHFHSEFDRVFPGASQAKRAAMLTKATDMARAQVRLGRAQAEQATTEKQLPRVPTRADVLNAIERGRASVPALARTSAQRGTKPATTPKPKPLHLMTPREKIEARISADARLDSRVRETLARSQSVPLKDGERFGQFAQEAGSLALPEVRKSRADAGPGWSKAVNRAGLVRREG